jgi:hypothetical protein
MSDLPNPRKGEALITINEEEYLLRLNFSAMVKLLKANKMNGKMLFEAISEMDYELIAQTIHVGIVSGKQWPERYGNKPPTQDQLMDVMLVDECDEYVYSVMEAMKGAEFVADIKKKMQEGEGEK